MILRHGPCLALLLALVCFPVISNAQQFITLESTVSGTVTPGNIQRWEFTAETSSLLSFIVTSGDPALDPIITLRDSDGDVLLINDDYNYPDQTHALIEGFDAPYTGTYTVEVSSFGNTSGSFNLRMLPGFANLAQYVDYTASNWQLVDAPPATALNSSAGRLTLRYEGISADALVVGVRPPTTPYYADMQINSVEGRGGWYVGLIFHYQDADNFARLLINHQGWWSLTETRNGQRRILRDWNSHPAIPPGAGSFRLGLLAKDNAADVFYNGHLLGGVSNLTLTQGQIGIAGRTVDAIGADLNAEFARTLITSPIARPVTARYQQALVSTGTNAAARELEHRLLIPAGGEMIYRTPQVNAQNVESGVFRFPLSNDLRRGNFVLTATVSWNENESATNGCGLVVRDEVTQDRYVLAYIDNRGGYGLSQRVDDQFVQNYFNNTLTLSSPYRMVLIANEDQVYFYINGQYVAMLQHPLSIGAIGTAVVNFDAVMTNCDYRNLWIWSWG